MSFSGINRGCIKFLEFIVLLVVLAGYPSESQAQPEAAPALEKGDIPEIIDSVLNAFELHYVYPDTARAMSKFIRGRYSDGAYDTISDLGTLTGQLKIDLREFTQDRHIWVGVMSPDDGLNIGDTVTNEQIEKSAYSNHGFRKVEWLTGNVGYLRIDRFEYANYAGEVASTALNFLARCDAVIIDLRYNGGGDETMVKLLASYFFKKPTIINALYFTETDSLEQSWTSAYVPGHKLVDADVYILVGEETASGAEAFSYGMKHAGRATVIGKATAGAAHWTECWDIPNIQVTACIPIARPINPITKTDWERTGVTPDIDVDINKALSVAHTLAIKKIMERTTDEQKLKGLAWDLTGAEAQADPITLSRKEMQAYTGLYRDGRNAILIKDDVLYWRNSEGFEFIIFPITRDLFGFDDSDYYRVEIGRDDKGAVNAFRILVRDGEPGPFHSRSGDL